MDSRHGILDATCPLDCAHPLNRGLIGDWSVPPLSGWRGGNLLRDLVRGAKSPHDGTLAGLSSPNSWSTFTHLGGYGSLHFPASSSSYVSLPTTFAQAASSNWSLVWWQKMDTTGGSTQWFAGNSSDDSGVFSIQGTGLTLNNVGGNSFIFSGIADFTPFNHYVLTAGIDGAGSDLTLYVNGEVSAVKTGINAAWNWNYIGRRPDTSFPFAGWLDGILFYQRPLTGQEAPRLYLEACRGNPERWRWLRQTVYGLPSSSNNYLLSTSPGNLNYRAQPSQLSANRVLGASSSFTVDRGQSAYLIARRILAVSSGESIVNGLSTSLLANRVLVVSSGKVPTNNLSASLLMGRVLVVSSGNVATNSFLTSLLANRLLTGFTGNLLVDGTSAVTVATRLLIANFGLFALGGQPSSLLQNRFLLVDSGMLTPTGSTIDSFRGYVLGASSVSIALGYRPIGFNVDRSLVLIPGNSTLCGRSAGLLYAPTVNRAIFFNVSSSKEAHFEISLSTLQAFQVSLAIPTTFTVFAGILQSFTVALSVVQSFQVNDLMAIQTNLTCPRGQRRVWTFSYNPPQSIDGANYVFTVRDTTGNVLLQLSSSAGDIAITDPVNGVGTITATATDTTIPVQQGEWDLWRVDPGYEDKIGYGLFIVTPNIRLWNS